ncbi:MAG: hypothetical protein HY343_12265 [Lentisphaerae bacterium]|nr:hypothetical protein [Lentisphaerota bacterium]
MKTYATILAVMLLLLGWRSVGSAQQTNTPAAGAALTNEANNTRAGARDKDDRAFRTRVFRVQPFICENCIPRSTTNEPIDKYYRDAGVPFPEGSHMFYSPDDFALVVHGPDEMISKVEAIMVGLIKWPSQVEITASFVAIGQRSFEKAGIGKLLEKLGRVAPTNTSTEFSVQNITSLSIGRSSHAWVWRSKAEPPRESLIRLAPNHAQAVLHALETAGAQVIAEPRLITKSGMNAEIKIADEIIYPTKSSGAFEKRDVGVLLNVTPVVGPDGYTIDLTLLPQYVELAGWEKYRVIETAEDGTTEQNIVRKPIFRSCNLTTSVTLWDGQTLVMGGVPMGEIKPSFVGRLFGCKPERKLLFIFITARLLDPAGLAIQF